MKYYRTPYNIERQIENEIELNDNGLYRVTVFANGPYKSLKFDIKNNWNDMILDFYMVRYEDI